MNTFYQEKKAEAMRKFNTLKEQLSVTEEHNKRIDEGDVELLKKNFGSDEEEAARGE